MTHPLHSVLSEGQFFAGGQSLLIEGGCNVFIGMGGSQCTDALDHGWGCALDRPGNLKFSHSFALPADANVEGCFPSGQGDIFDQETEQLLAVGVGRSLCLPDGWQVLGQGQDALLLLGAGQTGRGLW